MHATCEVHSIYIRVAGVYAGSLTGSRSLITCVCMEKCICTRIVYMRDCQQTAVITSCLLRNE